MIPESAADRDYPQMAAERGRVEPAPRRVRGYVDGVLVFDTVAARYVWEVPYYPQYYVPMKDVRTQYLVDEDHAQRVQFGTSREPRAPRQRGDDGRGRPRLRRRRHARRRRHRALHVGRVDWFEEDERIVGGHPRNPYARVDALRSHRHVRVELDGVVLADTHAPVLLFETGLPTRYYIDRTDVTFEHLLASDTETACPYKGVTSGYWSVRVGDTVHADVAWTYQYPDRAVAAIAGMVAFYNEQVDIVVDGIPLPRPRTHFAR